MLSRSVPMAAVRALSILSVCIMLVGARSVEGNVMLRGAVVDSVTGVNLGGVAITLINHDIRVISDVSGRFSLPRVQQGLYRLQARLLGFKDYEQTVRLYDDTTVLQIKMAPDIVGVPGITVTASRIPFPRALEPQTTEVVTSAQVRSRSLATTADMLAEEPAVTVQKTTYAHGAPVVRGLIGNYVLIQYDGVRLNKSTFRFGPNQYLNTTDEYSVDKVELVKGPVSVLYGSDGIGGTINLRTEDRFSLDSRYTFNPNVTVRYSTADDGRVVSAGADVIGKDLSVQGRISLKEFDHVRAGGDIGTQNPTGWNARSASMSTAYRIDSTAKLSVDYLAVRQDDIPRYDKIASGSHEMFEYDTQDRDLAVIAYERDFAADWAQHFYFNASYQREKELRLERRSGSSITTKSEDEVGTFGSSIQMVSRFSRPHSAITGGEIYHDKVDSRRLEIEADIDEEVRPTFPNDSRYTSLGIFNEHQFVLTQTIRLRSGIRYSWFRLSTELDEPFDETTQDFNNFTVSTGLLANLSGDLVVYGNYAQGFRAPNLDDAAVLRTTNTGIDAPNPDLEAERSHYGEVGLRFSDSRLSTRSAIFYNRMTNLIDRRPGTYLGLTFFDLDGDGVPDVGEPDVFQKRNVGEAETMGVEMSLSVRPAKQWTVYGFASWTRGTNLTDGEPLSRIPPLTGQSGVKTEVGSHFDTELFVRFASPQRRVSERDSGDSRIGPDGTDGWVTVNTRSSWTIGPITIGLLMENIFDRAYKTHGSGICSPGRNLVFTVSYGD